MKWTRTEIPGVVIIEPRVHRDERGFFVETYHAGRYAAAGILDSFVQDNHSCSRRGTLRGLHAQHRRPQAKLMRVVEGEVFDVVVDIRLGSPTFKKWVGIRLSGSDGRQIFAPAGFAHGFCVLSDQAHFEYKVSDYYDPDGELTVLWNDPELGIQWPVDDPLVSPKDRQGRPLAELADLLPRYWRPRGTP